MVTWPLLRMSGVGSWVPLRSGWHSLLGLWVRGVLSGSLWGEWCGPRVPPPGGVVWSPGPPGVCGVVSGSLGREWCGPWVPRGCVVWSPGPYLG